MRAIILLNYMDFEPAGLQGALKYDGDMRREQMNQKREMNSGLLEGKCVTEALDCSDMAAVDLITLPNH